MSDIVSPLLFVLTLLVYANFSEKTNEVPYLYKEIHRILCPRVVRLKYNDSAVG